jgi:formylmethanofuran dehydrogenase subunit D
VVLAVLAFILFIAALVAVLAMRRSYKERKRRREWEASGIRILERAAAEARRNRSFRIMRNAMIVVTPIFLGIWNFLAEGFRHKTDGYAVCGGYLLWEMENALSAPDIVALKDIEQEFFQHVIESEKPTERYAAADRYSYFSSVYLEHFRWQAGLTVKVDKFGDAVGGQFPNLKTPEHLKIYPNSIILPVRGPSRFTVLPEYSVVTTSPGYENKSELEWVAGICVSRYRSWHRDIYPLIQKAEPPHPGGR